MSPRREEPTQTFLEVSVPQTEQRMKFIPELRDKIRDGLGGFVKSETVDRAFEQWDAGEEPKGIVVGAIFQYFRDVQKQVEEQK